MKARTYLGRPYAEMDCITLIMKIIRNAYGGIPGYRDAGTNDLWRSRTRSGKYRHLTETYEGLENVRAGYLVFKSRDSKDPRFDGTDIHHVGLVTPEGTVIHSSSVSGKVVEEQLSAAKGWTLCARHRYIIPGKENPIK